MMPPPLPPAFRWTVETWGLAIRCRPLEAVAQHAFTTRQLRLRLPATGADEPYRQSWRAAAESVGGTLEQVMRVRQVHGAAVRLLQDGNGAERSLGSEERPEADAQVTNRRGLVLAVQVADCVPILMADVRSGAVAAVHAGWRGTAARIGPAVVRAMHEALGVSPSDIIAALGPSIGPCCYEVGAELILKFRAAGFAETEVSRWFSSHGSSLRLDVAGANLDQLVDAGVPASQVFAAGLCTKSHPDWLESFRGEGEGAGRMAGLIACGGGRR